MLETRKQMSDEEIAEFTRKAHDRVVAEVAAQMGRELIENRKRELAEKETKLKTEHEALAGV